MQPFGIVASPLSLVVLVCIGAAIHHKRQTLLTILTVELPLQLSFLQLTVLASAQH